MTVGCACMSTRYLATIRCRCRSRSTRRPGLVTMYCHVVTAVRLVLGACRERNFECRARGGSAGRNSAGVVLPEAGRSRRQFSTAAAHPPRRRCGRVGRGRRPSGLRLSTHEPPHRGAPPRGSSRGQLGSRGSAAQGTPSTQHGRHRRRVLRPRRSAARRLGRRRHAWRGRHAC